MKDYTKGKDTNMDKELVNFFNMFIIKSECDEISLKFRMLPLERQKELFKKYLKYFFNYTITSSVNVTTETGIEDDYWDQTGCKPIKSTLYYAELCYGIETDSEEAMDTFNLRVLYTIERGRVIIRAVLLYVTYDAFEVGSIGFVIDKDRNLDQDFITNLFDEAYNDIMSDDELHVWLMFQGAEDLVKQVLIEKNFNFEDRR